MSMNQQFLDTVLNLSKYHREHEKFYAKAPLTQALELQQVSGVLKTLAERWSSLEAGAPLEGNPYLGCEDLNDTAIIQHTGVLFMEGEAEPAEITRFKRSLTTLADDFAQTGQWLSRAMASSWESAKALIPIAPLAGVLGERHRIITNDWQASYLSLLVAESVRRALDILARVEFAPARVRADLEGPKAFPDYLYAASELLDHAADLISQSATLVHENDRRWRVFRKQLQHLSVPSEGVNEHPAQPLVEGG